MRWFLFSCLWQEALSSDFSPTLCWMVLQSYGQPRVTKGLESYSHQVQTKQGILAGCPLTTTLLRVLYFRTLARLAQQHSSVSFWGPGRRLVHPLAHFQSSWSRPSQGLKTP